MLEWPAAPRTSASVPGSHHSESLEGKINESGNGICGARQGIAVTSPP